MQNIHHTIDWHYIGQIIMQLTIHAIDFKVHIFVAFSEYMNFNKILVAYTMARKCKKEGNCFFITTLFQKAI